MLDDWVNEVEYPRSSSIHLACHSRINSRLQSIMAMITQKFIQAWIHSLSSVNKVLDPCTCNVSLCPKNWYASLNKDIMLKLYYNRWWSQPIFLDTEWSQGKSLQSSVVISDFVLYGVICYKPFCHIWSIGLQTRSINICEQVVIIPSQIPMHNLSKNYEFLGLISQINVSSPRTTCPFSHLYSTLVSPFCTIIAEH